jgi:hypothetical protein
MLVLFLGLLFSSIGGVYVFYGKRTYNASYLVCGVLLIVYPYVVPGALIMFIAGVILAAIPLVMARGWW